MTVTVLAVVSQFWDIDCSVSAMVAPYLASPPSNVMTPLKSSAKATLRVSDHDIGATGRPEKPVRLSTRLASELTAELDWAQQSLGLAADEILLAALGRAIARTIGDGVVAVDIARDGRLVSQPVYLTCAMGAHYGFGQIASHALSEIYFNYLGTVREVSSNETASETPNLYHALELRVYRTTDLLHLDWWYDTRRFYPSTVEELTEQFPLALIELTSDAIPPA